MKHPVEIFVQDTRYTCKKKVSLINYTVRTGHLIGKGTLPNSFENRQLESILIPCCNIEIGYAMIYNVIETAIMVCAESFAGNYESKKP